MKKNMKKLFYVLIIIFAIYIVNLYLFNQHCLVQKAVYHLKEAESSKQYYTDTVYSAFILNENYLSPTEMPAGKYITVLTSKNEIDSVSKAAYLSNIEDNKCFMIIFEVNTNSIISEFQIYFLMKDQRPLVTQYKYLWVFFDWIEISRKQLAS